MTITNDIHDLIDSCFFDKPRSLKEIKIKLENNGVDVKPQTLHPVIINIVANGWLIRQRNKSERWEYIKHDVNVGVSE